MAALPFMPENGDDADVTQILANDEYLLSLITNLAASLTQAQLVALGDAMVAAGVTFPTGYAP
jgi:hypothetical protein